MAPKVLITGANGYIASVTVSHFLSHGWHVRGTVRSAKSSAGLVSALQPYVDSGALEFAIVPDITLPGAFNAAVSGVDAIVHMASPVSLSFTDPDPVIHTAVQGTQTVLRSAFDFITGQRIFYGNAVNQLNSTQSYLQQEQVTLKSQENTLIGADLTKAATDLTRATTAHDAALAAAAKILPTSLLDYLK